MASSQDTSIQNFWNRLSDSDTVLWESGNGFSHGSFTANAAYSRISFVDGTASIVFDGTGDYISIPHSSIYNLTVQGTIVMWVNITNAPAGSTAEYFLSKRDGSSTGGYAFGYEDDAATKKVFSQFFNGSTTKAQVTQTLTPGTWYHIAWVWGTNPTTDLKCFINGIAQTVSYSASAATTIGTNTTAVTIGASALFAGTDIDAYIDSVKLSNTKKLDFMNAQIDSVDEQPTESNVLYGLLSGNVKRSDTSANVNAATVYVLYEDTEAIEDSTTSDASGNFSLFVTTGTKSVIAEKSADSVGADIKDQVTVS